MSHTLCALYMYVPFIHHKSVTTCCVMSVGVKDQTGPYLSYHIELMFYILPFYFYFII